MPLNPQFVQDYKMINVTQNKIHKQSDVFCSRSKPICIVIWLTKAYFLPCIGILFLITRRENLTNVTVLVDVGCVSPPIKPIVSGLLKLHGDGRIEELQCLLELFQFLWRNRNIKKHHIDEFWGTQNMPHLFESHICSNPISFSISFSIQPSGNEYDNGTPNNHDKVAKHTCIAVGHAPNDLPSFLVAIWWKAK